MSSVLVVGASGFAGSYLYKQFGLAKWDVSGTCHDHPMEGLHKLDITNKEAVFEMLGRIRPDVVCIPAAVPNVEYCEDYPVETAKVNVDGIIYTAQACKGISAKIVFFSTDYLFDGKKNGLYSEDDTPNPINVYGKQKLMAEHGIREATDDHIIARTTGIYGWEARGKNFVERLIRTLARGEDIRVPTDQFSSPTYVVNLSAMIADLVTNDLTGVFNVCGDEVMDRYRLSCLAAEVFGLDASLIKPVKTSELNQKATRPLMAGMKTEKIKRSIDTAPVSAREGLEMMKDSRDADG